MSSPLTLYTVLVSSAAKRDLKRIKKTADRDLLLRIDGKIQGLASDPRPPGCEPYQGMDGAYRIRVGDYRIIYTVDDSKRIVKIGRVRDRKVVYRHYREPRHAIACP